MEGRLVATFLGTFLVLIGIYIIVNPQFGFKINHFLERNPRDPTEKDLKMMKVSGVVTIVVGAAVLAGTFGLLQ